MLVVFLIKFDYVYKCFVPAVPLKKKKDNLKSLVIKAWLGGKKGTIAVEAHISLLGLYKNRV